MPLPGNIGDVSADVGGARPGFTPRVPDTSALGEGLRGLGRKLKQEEEVAKQALTRTQKSDALANLAQLETALSVDLDKLRREQGLAGPEYTQAAVDLVQKRTGEFLKQLPPDLRAEFKPRLAALQGKYTLNAYRAGVEGAGAQFVQKLQEAVTAQQELILKGEKTLEEAKADLNELLKNSPLLPEATEELRVANEQQLEILDLRTRTQDLALGATTETGTPPIGMALLDVIASVESKTFQDLWGGKKFSDFSDHPNILQRTPDGTPTTAAGRYQFIYKTWKRAQEALGLKDFSPKSQTKAAWWLAQEDYRKRTGRELLADLQSGQPERLIDVKRFLQDTWEGLKKLSDEEFIKRFTNAASKQIPGEVLSEKYRHVPVEARVQMWQEAQGLAQNAAQAALRAEAAQRKEALSALSAAIETGEAGLPEIAKAAETLGLSPEEIVSLQNKYQKTHEQAIAVSQIEGRVSNGAGVVGFKKEYVEAWGEQVLLPKYQEGNSFEVLQKVRAAGQVPQIIINAVTADAQALDPVRRRRGLETLAALQQLNLLSPKDVPQGLAQQAATYRVLSRYMDPNEIMGKVLATEPETVKAREELIKQGKKVLAKKLQDAEISPKTLVNAVGGGGLFTSAETDPALANRLLQEYLTAFPEAYAIVGDTDKAEELAVEWLKQRWGRTELGGASYVVPLPPEKVYPSLGEEGTAWVDRQVRSTFGLADGEKYVLLPTPETELEVRQARAGKLDRLPAYAVAIVNEDDGTVDILTDETGRYRLFYPSESAPLEQKLTTPEAVQKRATTEIWRLMQGRTDFTEQEAEILGLWLAQLTQIDNEETAQKALTIYQKLRKGQTSPEELATFLLNNTPEELRQIRYPGKYEVETKLAKLALKEPKSKGAPPETPQLSTMDRTIISTVETIDALASTDIGIDGEDFPHEMLSDLADLLTIHDQPLAEETKTALRALPESAKQSLKAFLIERGYKHMDELFDAGN